MTEGALGFADDRATTRLELFYDFTQPPREFQTIGAPQDASFFLHDKRPATDPDDDDDDQ